MMKENNNYQAIILSENETKVQLLTDLLSRYYSMNVAFVCHCAAEAIESLNHHQTMIFFLDLKFSEVINDIRKPPFIVGLCDIKSTKRIKNYLKMGFFDFLHAPFTERELNCIMGKILNIYGAYSKMTQKTIRWVEEENVKYAVNECAANSVFIITSRNGDGIRVMFDHVLFIKKVGNYVSVHFEDGTSEFFRQNLKEILTYFPQSKFQKINKSVVMNLEKVTEIENNRIIIDKITHFEMSRSYKKSIMEFFRQ